MDTEGPAGRTPVLTPLERMLRIERSMLRIRWFGIALAIYQVYWYQPFPGTPVPAYMEPLSAIPICGLAVMNLVVRAILRGTPSERTMRVVGATGFAADMAALWAFTWIFSFEQFGATWVTLLIATLEGAFRYQLRGALLPLAIALPIESIREVYRAKVLGFGFFLDGVTFRLGMMAIVGSVAGVMSRNLERERAATERHAEQLARLAEREAAARRESSAFQQVILAGVSAIGMQEALRSMIDHIADELGYERLVVLILEEGRLHPVALRGFPAGVQWESVALGEGIAGAVALTGHPEIVPDVTAEPRYFEVDPSTRSQVTVPIRAGDEMIGVLDVESPEADAFDAADLARLERLGQQMALVVSNARLLAQERATVERLRELDAMKSDFIAIASHELRTPLTAMQGSIKTLLRPDLRATREEQREFLSILERQSDRLTRLVEDLLMVSRIDAGGVSLRTETVDVARVLADTIAELAPPPERVSLAVPAEMRPVVTDGGRLGQIARNLIENAIKFSPDRTTVRVTAHRQGKVVAIDVADDGSGIPEAEIPHVFERFHQVGGALRRRGEGFGLGLYITRRLVDALGGTIEVESLVGKGTTFRVRIPAVDATDSASEIA